MKQRQPKSQCSRKRPSCMTLGKRTPGDQRAHAFSSRIPRGTCDEVAASSFTRRRQACAPQKKSTLPPSVHHASNMCKQRGSRACLHRKASRRRLGRSRKAFRRRLWLPFAIDPSIAALTACLAANMGAVTAAQGRRRSAGRAECAGQARICQEPTRP